MTEELQQIVSKVREAFLEDVEQNTELYFEGDVEKIREDDWYVTRFVLRNKKKLEPSIDMITNCMRWRKEFGVPFMKDQDFPQELFKIAGMFPYGPDLEGNAMVYMRVKMHRKIPELEDPLKHYVIHVLNKVDVEADGKGMGIVFDCSGAGLINVDMDMLWFLVSTMNKYYPKGLSYILVYELPWILNFAWKIAKAWIPEDQRKLIKFANKKDITNYIDPENLPDFMGGNCQRSYRVIPKGCPSAEEVGRELGLKDAQIDRVYKIFEPYLNEVDQAN